MHISYNDVPLEIVTFDRVERRSVMSPDQTTVLYTEWAISLSCVYHPSVGTYHGTSVTFANESDREGSSAPPTSLGRSPQEVELEFPGEEYPILSDRELLVRLAIPRKPLIIWAYDTEGNQVVWLESPRRVNNTYLPRDAAHGPIVQANVVTATLGNGVSFGVQMEIKTWVPPCPEGSDRLILAHRWQTSHTQDENHYLTRAVSGELYFHGGLVDQFGIRPDAVARQLLHPIPLGFRRVVGPTTLSPDGLVLRYSFADVDQKVTFDPGQSGATLMAISEVINYRTPFQGQEIVGEAVGKATDMFLDYGGPAAMGMPWLYLLRGGK